MVNQGEGYMGAHCTILAIFLKFLVFKTKSWKKKSVGKGISPSEILKESESNKAVFFWEG